MIVVVAELPSGEGNGDSKNLTLDDEEQRTIRAAKAQRGQNRAVCGLREATAASR